MQTRYIRLMSIPTTHGVHFTQFRSDTAYWCRGVLNQTLKSTALHTNTIPFISKSSYSSDVLGARSPDKAIYVPVGYTDLDADVCTVVAHETPKNHWEASHKVLRSGCSRSTLYNCINTAACACTVYVQ